MFITKLNKIHLDIEQKRNVKKQRKRSQRYNVLNFENFKSSGTGDKNLDFDVSEYRELFREFNATFVPRAVPQDVLVREFCKMETKDQEAFYIVDVSKIVRQYLQWKKYLPRITPFYAVKCNSSPVMLKTLAKLGANFDCASKQEIQMIMEMGLDVESRIIYANPCKQLSHMRFAKQVGVSMVTVDNEAELYKHKDHWSEVGIVLRIAVDDSNSVCKFSSKYGAPLEDVPHLLNVAKDLGLNMIGVSFHVGSGCYSVDSFVKALKDAKTVFDIAEKVGFNFTVLDIGGGFPGTDDNSSCRFVDIAKAINEMIDKLFPKVKIIAEPGRYFASASHTMVCNIFSKRKNKVEQGSQEPEFLYYINDGLYGAFNCLFFDHAKIDVKTISSGNEKKKHLCTIFGPTCDALDRIAEKIYLPELEIGDWIYVPNFGAYTVSAASEFNGFKTVKTHFIWQN
jgi:ornithine decarboxylase